MMEHIDTAFQYANQHFEDHLASLLEWLCIPSISTSPEYSQDMQRAANWLADHLNRIGLEHAEVFKTTGHPIVYAEWMKAEAASPTLLIYGHYDVQPVDPIEEWRTPPFKPTVLGKDLYCRGASDDKGQVLAILSALEAYLQSVGRLPVNVKLLIEGEEEVNSPSLIPFIQTNQDQLRADAILVCDQAILAPDLPLIMYGLRGNLYMEIEVRGPAHDLHSGTFGGAVDNPFNVLVFLLSQLQDRETHRIAIPGFYDRVRPLEQEERDLIARAPLNEQVGLHLTGAPALSGEQGYTLAERVSVRPTFDIHGIVGGFTGEGKKTVIPAKAYAKLSMRLVPDQEPEEIAKLVETYLRSLVPPTVKLELRITGTARPLLVDFNAPAIQAAARAYQRSFGVSPVYLRGGGSVPIMRPLQDKLNVPIVMIGFGLPDDNTHAPNEKIHLPLFRRGIETIIYYLSFLSGKQE